MRSVMSACLFFTSFLVAASIGCSSGSSSSCMERCPSGKLVGPYAVSSVDGDLEVLGLRSVDQVEMIDRAFRPGDTGSSTEVVISFTRLDGSTDSTVYSVIATTAH